MFVCLLCVAVAGPFSLHQHVQWHTINARDFCNLQLARFDELRFVVGCADGLVLRLAIKNGKLPTLAAFAQVRGESSSDLIPAFFSKLCLSFQNSLRPATAAEEFGGVFLHGHTQRQAVAVDLMRRVALKLTRSPKAANRHHIAPGQLAASAGAICQPVHHRSVCANFWLHTAFVHGLNLHDAAGALEPLHRVVGLPHGGQAHDHALLPLRSGHVVARLPANQRIARIVFCALAAFGCGAVQVQRQRANRFCNQPHCRPRGGDLQLRVRTDRNIGPCGANAAQHLPALRVVKREVLAFERPGCQVQQ